MAKQPWRRSRMKPGTVIASLDIGSSKIACLIGRIDPKKPAGFVFMGAGRQQSHGFSAGTITNIDALEHSVRLAVDDAERAAGERIERVILGITGPRIDSRLTRADSVSGLHEINVRDVRQVWTEALVKAVPKERELLAACPLMYIVDDQDGIRDPVGMIGKRLEILLNVVTAPKTLIDNIRECLQRAHLDVSRVIPSALATGAGCLIDDEIRNGALCIDFGDGVTAVSAFLDGAPAWLNFVRIGGTHITSDIAQCMGTTFAAAERLKTVYGIAGRDATGMVERIRASRLGDDGQLYDGYITRGQLAAIITPRVEEVFEMVRAALTASALRPILPRRTVLTGGSSQIFGIRDVAAHILEQPVRLGRPVNIDISGEICSNASFSTAAGLIRYECAGFADASTPLIMVAGKPTHGLFARAFRWFQDNF